MVTATATATPAVNRGLMKKYRAMLLLILSYTMISCGSENSNDGTSIELASPAVNRQVIESQDIMWKALIQVNSGPAQILYFTDSALPTSATVDGIRRNEQNDISIKWFEILHGHTVEMSEQSQPFFADGTTIIDSQHRYTQFDYDRDGTSNLVEHIDGTCVWSATESCLNPGQTDIPTDNALLNGDFSDGIGYWYTDLPVLSETSGEYCVTAPAIAQERWDARIKYLPVPLFIDSNTSYNIVFDVRAQTNSKVFVQLSARIFDDFESLDDSSVDVSTTYETKTIRYESAEDAYSEVSIDFTFGNGIDNTYCFDNIKLIREASQ